MGKTLCKEFDLMSEYIFDWWVVGAGTNKTASIIIAHEP
jgi:hypothetical protein